MKISKFQIEEIYRDVLRRLVEMTAYLDEEDTTDYMWCMEQGVYGALSTLAGEDWPEVAAVVDQVEEEFFRKEG